MARVDFCAGCGAPLDAPWREIVIVCPYCGSQTRPGGAADPVPSSTPADGRPRLNLDGRTYVIEGRIARGDSCDVYRGRWVRRLGELVVIKVLRSSADADLLRQKHRILVGLRGSTTRGAEHFVRRLPSPIAFGPVSVPGHPGAEGARLASVHGWPAGFVHTLEEVGDRYPAGVDGRVGAWLAKRLLELLAWTHDAGVVHGAVIPPHVLVQPRAHGAMLVGWGTAVEREGAGFGRLPALSSAWSAFYPQDALTAPASPVTDVVMASRCALAAMGERPGGPALPEALVGALTRVLRQGAQGAFAQAWPLREAVDAAAREQFGAAAYHPLPMPGWR